MQSTRNIQIVLVLLTCGLIAFLFFNGRSNSSALPQSGKSSEPAAMSAPSGSFNFTLLETDTKAKLSKADAAEVASLEKKIQDQPQSTEALLALAQKYEALKQPALAGYYYQKLAEKEPKKEAYWFGMGKNFFEAQQLVDDSTSYAYFVQLSSIALDKALTMNPNNFEAKADQAVNYIEGKGETMKGVGMLREIIQLDSNNRKALFYLGVLSIQSNQLDKAAGRFQRLIDLGEGNDPNYPYYFRYLGQAYLMQGQKDKALKAFMQYKAYTDVLSDPIVKQEAAQLIQAAQQK